MIRRAILGIAVAAIFTAASPATAQDPAVSAAIRDGRVGERFDGYLAFAEDPSPTLRKQVSAVNIRRRSLYIALASRRGVLPQTASIAAGCELLGRVGVGQRYLWKDGIWRRRDSGDPPPVPADCP